MGESIVCIIISVAVRVPGLRMRRNASSAPSRRSRRLATRDYFQW